MDMPKKGIIEVDYIYENDNYKLGLGGSEVVNILSKYKNNTLKNFYNKFSNTQNNLPFVNDPDYKGKQGTMVIEFDEEAIPDKNSNYLIYTDLEPLPKKKHLILVSSCIHITPNALAYTQYRSIFTHKERLDQTIEGLKILREYFKDTAYIFLSESFILFPDEVELISKYADKILIFPEDIRNNLYYDGHKAGIEALVYYNMVSHISKINFDFDYLYKISGRYQLNDKFNIDDFNIREDVDPTTLVVNRRDEDRIVFNGNHESTNPLFYSIPKKWLYTYLEDLSPNQNNCHAGIEFLLFLKRKERPSVIKPNVDGESIYKIIPKVNVSGYCAVYFEKVWFDL
jgi:hypothetical protein